MDILKRASARSSPNKVAFQIIKYGPPNHPKTKKYLKLLNRFGSDSGWLQQPGDSTCDHACNEACRAMLNIAWRSIQQQSTEKVNTTIQCLRKKIEVLDKKGDFQIERAYLENLLNIYQNHLLPPHEKLEGVNTTVASGDISLSDFEKILTEINEAEMKRQEEIREIETLRPMSSTLKNVCGLPGITWS
tara:strand:+ start:2103 stop:2669 length:567 start_codon:yes stop_codon:yes gene_type:complete